MSRKTGISDWSLCRSYQSPCIFLLKIFKKILKLKKKKHDLFVATPVLRCCVQAFSSLGEQGLLSSRGVWHSHEGGSSRCRARARGCMGFSRCAAQAQDLWCTVLVTLRHVKSSWTRGQPHVPCIGRWIFKKNIYINFTGL